MKFECEEDLISKFEGRTVEIIQVRKKSGMIQVRDDIFEVLREKKNCQQRFPYPQKKYPSKMDSLIFKKWIFLDFKKVQFITSKLVQQEMLKRVY